MNIICERCGKQFEFSIGEQRFYSEHQLEYPKRCKACIEEQKKIRNETQEYIRQDFKSSGESGQQPTSHIDRKRESLVRWKKEHWDYICSNCNLIRIYDSASVLQFFCHNCVVPVDESTGYHQKRTIERCYFAENTIKSYEDYINKCMLDSKLKNNKLICLDCCLPKNLIPEDYVRSLACPICRLANSGCLHEFFKNENADAYINGELQYTYYNYLKYGYKSLHNHSSIHVF